VGFIIWIWRLDHFHGSLETAGSFRHKFRAYAIAWRSNLRQQSCRTLVFPVLLSFLVFEQFLNGHVLIA
jgi:hypothetical protein